MNEETPTVGESNSLEREQQSTSLKEKSPLPDSPESPSQPDLPADEEKLLESPANKRATTTFLEREPAPEEKEENNSITTVGAEKSRPLEVDAVQIVDIKEALKPRILEITTLRMDITEDLWREGWFKPKRLWPGMEPTEPVLVLRQPRVTFDLEEGEIAEDVVADDRGKAEAQSAKSIGEPIEMETADDPANEGQATSPSKSRLLEPMEGIPEETSETRPDLPIAVVPPPLHSGPPLSLAAERPNSTREGVKVPANPAGTGAIPKRKKKKSKGGKRPKEGSARMLTMDDYFSNVPTPPGSPSPLPGPAQWPPRQASRDGPEGQRPQASSTDEEDWDATPSPGATAPIGTRPPLQWPSPPRQPSPPPGRRPSTPPPLQQGPQLPRRDPVPPPAPPRTEHRPVRLRGVMFGGLNHVPTDPAVDPPAHSCFNCWERGHDRRRCPLPTIALFCHNCGRANVDLSNCPRCCMAHRAYLAQRFSEEELIEHELRQRRERAEERQQEEIWRRRWQEEQLRRQQEEQLRRQQEEQLRRQQEEQLHRQQEDSQQLNYHPTEMHLPEPPQPNPFHQVDAVARHRPNPIAPLNFGRPAIAVAEEYWRHRSEEEWRRIQREQGVAHRFAGPAIAEQPQERSLYLGSIGARELHLVLEREERAAVEHLPPPINALLFGPGPADAVERSLWLADQLRGYSPETRAAAMRAYYQLCDLQRLREM